MMKYFIFIVVIVLSINMFFYLLENASSSMVEKIENASKYKIKYNDKNLPYLTLSDNIKKNKVISLLLVGDLRLTNKETTENIINSILNSKESDLIDYLKSRDIFVGNLEMVFAEKKGGNCSSTKVADIKWIKLLKKLNINAVNLANNHFQFDGGLCAVKQTIEGLDKELIQYFGINNNLLIIKKDDIKIGFLGFAGYSNNDDMPPKFKVGDLIERDILIKIRESKGKVDHLIIMMHWGELGIKSPSPYDVSLTNKMFKEGASVIFGSGPHVLQKVDINGNHVVAYSLGNFIFDKYRYEDEFFESGMLEIKISKSSIETARFFPIITKSGAITIPKNEELEKSKIHFENLYQLNYSDYYKSYNLWNKFKGRVKLFLEDFKKSPVKAIEKNLKFKYIMHTFDHIWKNYILYIIIIGLLISGYIFIRLFKK